MTHLGALLRRYGQQVEERLSLEADFVRALQRDELQAHLQPQYSRDGLVSGAELLARWHHPIFGAIPPIEFIAIARKVRAMVPLTCRVLRLACQALIELDRLGDTYPLSVNVSSETLADATFICTMHEVLDACGMAAGRLILEITEDIPIVDLKAVVTHMHELAARGVRFSMDDFGTGYANFAYLKRLPLYELKIDRSLIEGLPDNDDSVDIIRLILVLARRLKLRVVAEGVETQRQADFLFRRRCDAVQGYLMAAPMPVESWICRRSTLLAALRVEPSVLLAAPAFKEK